MTEDLVPKISPGWPLCDKPSNDGQHIWCWVDVLCLSFSGSCIHHAWQTHGCVLAFERCISACTYVSHLICLPWLWPAVLHFVDCCPEAVPYMICLCSDHPLPDIVMAGARVFVQCFHALIWDLPWCGTGIFTQAGQWDNRPIADRVVQAQLL